MPPGFATGWITASRPWHGGSRHDRDRLLYAQRRRDRRALFAVTKTTSATYWIPTENEWYKAAYYKSGGTNAGYWTYTTKSNTAPSTTLFSHRHEQRELQ